MKLSSFPLSQKAIEISFSAKEQKFKSLKVQELKRIPETP
jgi:hypothetical protein